MHYLVKKIFNLLVSFFKFCLQSLVINIKEKQGEIFRRKKKEKNPRLKSELIANPPYKGIVSEAAGRGVLALEARMASPRSYLRPRNIKSPLNTFLFKDYVLKLSSQLFTK